MGGPPSFVRHVKILWMYGVYIRLVRQKFGLNLSSIVRAATAKGVLSQFNPIRTRKLSPFLLFYMLFNATTIKILLFLASPI